MQGLLEDIWEEKSRSLIREVTKRKMEMIRRRRRSKQRRVRKVSMELLRRSLVLVGQIRRATDLRDTLQEILQTTLVKDQV